MTSTPSGNGKNASDAATEPLIPSTDFIAPMRRRVHAAHLARADAGGLAVARVQNGIRLHVLADLPREQQVAHLLLGRLALAHNLEVGSASGRISLSCSSTPPETFFSTHFCSMGSTSTRRRFFLAAKISRAASVELRRGNDFEKQLRHLRRGFRVNGAVHANHSAKRRDWVALQRALVGFCQSGSNCGAAGIGVLDDGARPALRIPAPGPTPPADRRCCCS